MRRVLLILGLLVLAIVWLGPLPQLAQHAFFAHMTMHMAVVALAAPLIALGIAGERFDPIIKAPRWFAPIPALFVELPGRLGMACSGAAPCCTTSINSADRRTRNVFVDRRVYVALRFRRR